MGERNRRKQHLLDRRIDLGKAKASANLTQLLLKRNISQNDRCFNSFITRMKATVVCCYIPGHSSGTSNSSLSLVLATDISYLIPESQVQCWVIGASPVLCFSPANHIVTTSHFVHLHFDPPRPNSSKAWPLRVTWMPGSAGRWNIATMWGPRPR